MTENSIVQYIFSSDFVYADIYLCFERIMAFGIKKLYQISKDISIMKQEIYDELGIDQPANN